jgi:hypothetical protein
MVFKTILIVMVFAVLLEDSASIRKTEEERKEDEKLAERVNATLAAEEAEKKKEEEDEAKRKKKVKTQSEEKDEDEKGKDRNEAGPTLNCSCPTVESCRPCDLCEDCPVANCSGQCKVCPDVTPCKDCPVCKECGICPEVQPCKPCRPCGPDPVVNHTETTPSACQCPGEAVMATPVALAVGASAGVLLTGVAAAIGLILRYVDPIVSGFFFVATVVLIWYLSSHYPEAARELGGRATTLLREAAAALGHRVMAAIQRHNEQVGFPNLSFLE